MRATWVALASILPLAQAWAGPGHRGDPDGPAPDPARIEMMEKRMRTLRVVGIAEALDLDAPEALKLDALMRPFDERRRPLQRQMHEALHVLRRAANGDANALPKVDEATSEILSARAQMAQIDREMYTALTAGRSPQQKARLALFFAHFQEEARGFRAMMRNGPDEHGFKGDAPR